MQFEGLELLDWIIQDMMAKHMLSLLLSQSHSIAVIIPTKFVNLPSSQLQRTSHLKKTTLFPKVQHKQSYKRSWGHPRLSCGDNQLLTERIEVVLGLLPADPQE
jgi:hypothetical protein